MQVLRVFFHCGPVLRHHIHLLVKFGIHLDDESFLYTIVLRLPLRLLLLQLLQYKRNKPLADIQHQSLHCRHPTDGCYHTPRTLLTAFISSFGIAQQLMVSGPIFSKFNRRLALFEKTYRVLSLSTKWINQLMKVNLRKHLMSGRAISLGASR